MYLYVHNDHVALPAQISTTLSRHPSLSSIAPGRSSRLYSVSAQLLYIGSSWSSSLCSSMGRGPQEYIAYEFVPTSPACLVRLTLILYLFNITRSILVKLLSSFFSIRLLSVHVVDSYSSGGCPRGVMVKATDCGIVVSEFELRSPYYIHFRTNTLGKGMNPLILPAMA